MIDRTVIATTSLLAAAALSSACDGGTKANATPTAAPSPSTAAPAAPAAPDPAAQIARGKYLVDVAGCHDCHTPWVMGPKGPEPDMTRMLMGHPADLVMPPAPPPSGPWIVAAAGTMTAWSGPWGVSFTRNLTPDDETGIGAWDVDTFIATIRNARHMGRGRPLLPPMPAANYAKMTDEDLAAMFAYLQSIPAISNRVPEPLPPAAPPQ